MSRLPGRYCRRFLKKGDRVIVPLTEALVNQDGYHCNPLTHSGLQTQYNAKWFVHHWPKSLVMYVINKKQLDIHEYWGEVINWYTQLHKEMLLKINEPVIQINRSSMRDVIISTC